MRFNPKTLIAGGIAAAILAVVPAAGATTTIQTGGSTGMQVVASALAQQYTKTTNGKIRITVSGGGSGAGVNGANSGTFAWGDSSNAASAYPDAKYKGLVFTPITVEPFVVIVNKANKVSNLTLAQIQGIFKGEITNWKDVGGSDCAIKGYTRISGSGTLSTFKTLYLGSSTASISSTFSAQGSNGLVRSGVAGNKCGVGFVTFAYTVGTTLPIKPVAVDGVAPSLANAKAGKFGYTGYQFFVTKGDPTGDAATYFQWCRTDPTAQKIISKYALGTTADPQNT